MMMMMMMIIIIFVLLIITAKMQMQIYKSAEELSDSLEIKFHGKSEVFHKNIKMKYQTLEFKSMRDLYVEPQKSISVNMRNILKNCERVLQSTAIQKTVFSIVLL